MNGALEGGRRPLTYSNSLHDLNKDGKWQHSWGRLGERKEGGVKDVDRNVYTVCSAVGRRLARTRAATLCRIAT